MDISAIQELSQFPQWVCWDYEGEINPATGKRKKMPKNPTTGGNAQSTNAATWGTYRAATMRREREMWAGVGFVFSAADPYCGIDLDNCIDDDGTITETAWAIIDALNSYTEVSPSGRGVKIFCRGAISKSLKIADIGGGMGLEMYTSGRFFVVTGNRLHEPPDMINDAQAALDDLVMRYKKPDALVMPPIVKRPTNGAVDMAYPAAWVGAIVERVKRSAVNTMAMASDGNKHNSRLAAGEMIGGYIAALDAIGYGSLLSPDDAAQLIYDANPPTANHAVEYRTVAGAIAHGMRAPLPIDRPPLEYSPNPVHATSATERDETPNTDTIAPVTLDRCPASPSIETITQCLNDDESGDARLFKALYGDRLAYDHSGGAWFLWNGHAWREDTTGIIRPLIEAHLGRCYLALATRLNSDAASEPDMNTKDRLLATVKQLQKRAAILHKLQRQNNIETLCRFYFGVAGDMWDSQPFLLAVANGVVDLRTGDLIPGQPAHYLRTVAPTTYGGMDTPAPRWAQFLDELFEPGSPYADIPAYLARLFGYGVLGLVREAVLPVLYGAQGRNGKDTMLKALGRVLGPHAGAMGNDVLISTGRGRDAGAASPHLIDLFGKRIVWASEPEDGQRFSVGQAKQLSGGGQISARAVYGKRTIKFSPTHLMLLLTNHKPKAPSDDEAFWSRVHLIPFIYRFLEPHKFSNAPHERLADTGLDDKLAAESAGILAWLVRGCLEYQQLGIRPPEAVRQATADYQEDEDTLGDFADECIIDMPGTALKAGTLFERYQGWSIKNGYKPLTSKTFGTRMKDRYESARGNTGMVYLNIALLSVVYDDPD